MMFQTELIQEVPFQPDLILISLKMENLPTMRKDSPRKEPTIKNQGLNIIKLIDQIKIIFIYSYFNLLYNLNLYDCI